MSAEILQKPNSINRNMPEGDNRTDQTCSYDTGLKLILKKTKYLKVVWGYVTPVRALFVDHLWTSF